MAAEFLTRKSNKFLESKRMPEEWRSVLVLIFNKGDDHSCSNYRGIKLMSHTMKFWKRGVEARLRTEVSICFKYFGSTVQSNRACGKEVKKCVQAGWNGCRKVSGVMCD